MKKKILATVLAATSLCSCFAGVGCGGGEKKDPNALQIAVVNVGYGAKWATELAKAYTEKTGTKVQVDDSYTGGLDKGFIDELLSNATETDIYFSRDSMFDYATSGTTAAGTYYECIMEDLTDFYTADNPYDDKTVAEKIDPDILRDLTVQRDGKNKQYTVPWVSDILGILYNEKVFNDNDLTVPKTTDQLVQLCFDIKKIDGLTPFVDSYSSSYFNVVQEHWMTQYEGCETMDKLWQGYGADGKRYTPSLLQYEGLLETYRVLYDLMNAENNFIHKDSKDLTFTAAQNYILNSQKGVAMMPNGDWIQREMEDNYYADEIEIQMMKMPVISAINEKLSYYADGNTEYCNLDAAKKAKYDKALTAIIDYVDGTTTEKPTSVEGLTITDADIARVDEARNIVTGWSFGHIGYIPTYSNKKDVAKDFLHFMVSDEGLRIFTEATKGSTQPYKFDYLNDPRTSAVMNDFAKGVYNIFTESNVRAYEISKDPIFAHGGLTISYTWTETSIVTAFTQKKGGKNYYDAEGYFAYRYDYWKNKWDGILSAAGLI